MYLERKITIQAALPLLEHCGLTCSAQTPNYTVGIYEEDSDMLLATGSLVGDMLQMIAVSPSCQGEDLSAKVVTHLLRVAAQKGVYHLHLFTKPEKADYFRQLGFRAVVSVPGKAALLEWGAQGVDQFCRTLSAQAGPSRGRVGAVVMNCNPFTLGHQHLVEQTSRCCDRVIILAVQENLSEFPFEVRFELLCRGVAHLPNVTVLSGGRYVISSLTFPSYFTRSTELAAVQAAVDMALFARYIAPSLGITDRFLGTEPFSPVTELYNCAAVAQLEPAGIRVHLIERLALKGQAVSASRVRALLAQGKKAEVQALVPATTWAYLNSPDFETVYTRLIGANG
ncbi:[citrate (pro-3S)-lyase] ligase [Oscillospiraceae bacterium LTW-04]|nr:[citrate (pro-3S)-lyase] ligase [Oscillospiraceae bacterium MB24-C1]